MINNIQSPSIVNLNVLVPTEFNEVQQLSQTENSTVLGRNIVTESDKNGAAATTVSGDISGAPSLVQPDSSKVAEGKQSLYGSSNIISQIMTILMNSIEAAKEAKTVSRAVATSQQNASEVAGFNQVREMENSAKSMKDSAIVKGVFTGVGSTLGFVGMGGTIKKISKLKKTSKAAQTESRNKLQRGLDNLKRSRYQKKMDKYAGSSPAKFEKYQEKLQNVGKGMDKESKYEIMDAILQNGTSIANSAHETYSSFASASQKRNEAEGQYEAVLSERNKTERTKNEDTRETMKRAMENAQKTLADILAALSQATNAAVRA